MGTQSREVRRVWVFGNDRDRLNPPHPETRWTAALPAVWNGAHTPELELVSPVSRADGKSTEKKIVKGLKHKLWLERETRGPPSARRWPAWDLAGEGTQPC